jgi:hypothetical protein
MVGTAISNRGLRQHVVLLSLLLCRCLAVFRAAKRCGVRAKVGGCADLFFGTIGIATMKDRSRAIADVRSGQGWTGLDWTGLEWTGSAIVFSGRRASGLRRGKWR